MKRRSFFKTLGIATLFSGLSVNNVFSKEKNMYNCSLKKG